MNSGDMIGTTTGGWNSATTTTISRNNNGFTGGVPVNTGTSYFENIGYYDNSGYNSFYGVYNSAYDFSLAY